MHVYGRRYKPFGPQNYPDELKKTREMTALRDYAIWRAIDGKKSDLATADAKTHKLAPVKSNFKPSGKNGNPDYSPGKTSQTKLCRFHLRKKDTRQHSLRDYAIWRAIDGKKSDLATADAKTHKLAPVKSNFKPSGKNGNPDYSPGKTSQTKLCRFHLRKKDTRQHS